MQSVAHRDQRGKTLTYHKADCYQQKLAKETGGATQFQSLHSASMMRARRMSTHPHDIQAVLTLHPYRILAAFT